MENILTSAFENAAKALSLKEDENDIREIAERNQHRFNITGFFSPFSCVGQTTLVVNTGYILAKKGYKVCIVDLDLFRPDVFRYLERENNDEVRSISGKLVNSTVPITEFVNPSRFKNIVFVSSSISDHPAKFCISDAGENQSQYTLDTFTEMFADLSHLYDFVLLDIGDNITDIATIAAFSTADKIYAITDGSMKSIENLMKSNSVFSSIGMNNLFDSVIQTKVKGTAFWTDKDLKATNQNVSLIANIPYSDTAALGGVNLDIFYQTCKSIKPEDIKIKKCFETICDKIERQSHVSSLQEQILMEKQSKSREIASYTVIPLDETSTIISEESASIAHITENNEKNNQSEDDFAPVKARELSPLDEEAATEPLRNTTEEPKENEKKIAAMEQNEDSLLVEKDIAIAETEIINTIQGQSDNIKETPCITEFSDNEQLLFPAVNSQLDINSPENSENSDMKFSVEVSENDNIVTEEEQSEKTVIDEEASETEKNEEDEYFFPSEVKTTNTALPAYSNDAVEAIDVFEIPDSTEADNNNENTKSIPETEDMEKAPPLLPHEDMKKNSIVSESLIIENIVDEGTKPSFDDTDNTKDEEVSIPEVKEIEEATALPVHEEEITVRDALFAEGERIDEIVANSNDNEPSAEKEQSANKDISVLELAEKEDEGQKADKDAAHLFCEGKADEETEEEQALDEQANLPLMCDESEMEIKPIEEFTPCEDNDSILAENKQTSEKTLLDAAGAEQKEAGALLEVDINDKKIKTNCSTINVFTGNIPIPTAIDFFQAPKSRLSEDGKVGIVTEEMDDVIVSTPDEIGEQELFGGLFEAEIPEKESKETKEDNEVSQSRFDMIANMRQDNAPNEKSNPFEQDPLEGDVVNHRGPLFNEQHLKIVPKVRIGLDGKLKVEEIETTN